MELNTHISHIDRICRANSLLKLAIVVTMSGCAACQQSVPSVSAQGQGGGVTRRMAVLEQRLNTLSLPTERIEALEQRLDTLTSPEGTVTALQQ